MGVGGFAFGVLAFWRFHMCFGGSVPEGLSPSGGSCYMQASEGDELRFTVWFECDVLWAKEDNNVLDEPVGPSSFECLNLLDRWFTKTDREKTEYIVR